MGMLQLQQHEADVITISDTNTQGTQTVAEDSKITAAGAESATPSPDIACINLTQLPSFKWVPLPKEEMQWKQEKKERKICIEETQYDTPTKKPATSVFKEIPAVPLPEFQFQLSPLKSKTEKQLQINQHPLIWRRPLPLHSVLVKYPHPGLTLLCLSVPP